MQTIDAAVLLVGGFASGMLNIRADLKKMFAEF
jgi:hypothetical protein